MLWNSAGTEHEWLSEPLKPASQTGQEKYTVYRYISFFHQKHHYNHFARFTLHVPTPFNHRRIHPIENEITCTDWTTNLHDPEAETLTTTVQKRNVGWSTYNKIVTSNIAQITSHELHDESD